MKYVAIAHDVRLRRIELLLPPSLSTIHQIAQLNDEEFDEAIKAEIIRPNVRRSEIEGLRKAAANNDKATTPRQLTGGTPGNSSGQSLRTHTPR